MIDERWLTVADVARRLQVHPETVRRWLREGRLKGKNVGGKGGYRITEREVNAFIDSLPDVGKDAA